MVMFGALVPCADAARAPTSRERAAIKRLALKACEGGPNPCRFHKARVSTKNARYVWADVTGEGFSGALLKRANTRTRHFKVVGTQGGGIGECSYWRDLAPRAVLKDLRVSGLRDSSGAVGGCG
jgi:curli biogenesis system outer membrane secretion channel CsgG